MENPDVYEKLADHLSCMGVGLPNMEGLVDLLKANFTESEAKAALCIPNRCIPLKTISIDESEPPDGITKHELSEILEGLAERGMVISRRADDGGARRSLGRWNR